MEPNRSPYDLRWQMFGIPVRVHWSFWLLAAILGFNWLEAGFHYLLIWIACVFVSILVHEYGHALTARAFGIEGYIVLYSFGGLAIQTDRLRQRWKRITVTLMGPVAGFLLYGLLLAGRETGTFQGLPPEGTAALGMMVWINLYWGLFNLLPVFPLDGGQISRELCLAASPGNGVRTSLLISIAVAAFVCVNSLLAYYDKPAVPYLTLGTFGAILFGLLAFENYQLLQYYSRRDSHWDGGRGW